MGASNKTDAEKLANAIAMMSEAVALANAARLPSAQAAVDLLTGTKGQAFLALPGHRPQLCRRGEVRRQDKRKRPQHRWPRHCQRNAEGHLLSKLTRTFIYAQRHPDET